MITDRRGLLLHNWEQHTPTPRPRKKTHRQKQRKEKQPRESRPARRKRLAELEKEPVPILFQSNPLKRTNSFFAPKGFTGCLEGFFRSAKERFCTVLRNNKMLGQRFTHYCNLNLTAPRHPALIRKDFNAFVQELEKEGLVGHWTIEINWDNVVHWHMLFREYLGNKHTLKRCIESCLARVQTFPERRLKTDWIRNQHNKLRYCVKKKTRGRCKDSGVVVSDIYKRDRVLFKPNIGLAKHGTLGDFWAEGWNEKKLWKVISEEAKQVRKNLENPRVRKLVGSIHDLIGGSLRRIEWAYGLNPPRRLLEPQDSTTEPRSIRRTGLSGTGSLLAEIFGRSRLNQHYSEGPSPVPAMPSPLPTPIAPVPKNWFFGFLELAWEILKFWVQPLFKNTG